MPLEMRGMKHLLAALLVLLLLCCAASAAGVIRRKLASSSINTYVLIEFLQDNIAHVEYGAGTGPGSLDTPIYTTPMVAKTQFEGPSQFSEKEGNTFDTATMTLRVDMNSLCASFFYKGSDNNYDVTVMCPKNFASAATVKNVTLTKRNTQAIYGLGEQFWTGGVANGDWVGRVRTPGCGYYGNDMCGYQYVFFIF